MKNISIAIEITEKAFLPEAYAYKEYFLSKGHVCEFVKKGSPDALCYDAIFLFHGFHPFWKKYPKFIIGEYHSLSTGRYSRFKDFLKRLLNVRADFYVFLNNTVRRKIWHSRTNPYALRGMGFDSKHFGELKGIKKEHDLVYCGSMREGLLDKVEYLASLGLTIALVGFDYKSDNRNIRSFGRKSPEEARKIISQSRLGLNYTPSVFPLNIQDSTKVIEYCGAGLGVITNRYQWINDFEKERGGRFLNLEEVNNLEAVWDFEFLIPNVDDLSWDNLAGSVYLALANNSV